jgi:hypothetical protein
VNKPVPFNLDGMINFTFGVCLENKMDPIPIIAVFYQAIIPGAGKFKTFF